MGLWRKIIGNDEEGTGGAIRAALSRTRQQLWGRLSRLFTDPAGEEFSQRLEEILYTSDLGVPASRRLLETLRRGMGGERDLEKARQLLQQELLAILPPARPFALPDGVHPYVIMVVGVNGVGKTTAIGKLAHHLNKHGASVVLAAADTFRQAAIEQLAVWGERSKAAVVHQEYGADPGAVAYDAIQAARARAAAAVIIDTAGRLHTKVNLMEELKKVRRVCGKALPGAPHQTWLVVDATNGQNAIVQAREFHQAVELTGLIVTKLDGSAKGGVVVGISQELGLPIPFIGVGEGIEALRPFDPQQFTAALLAAEGEEP